LGRPVHDDSVLFEFLAPEGARTTGRLGASPMLVAWHGADVGTIGVERVETTVPLFALPFEFR